MASKRTSEVASGIGANRAAPILPTGPIRLPRTTGQPIPEPASPRDVPEPLGDLPPESVRRIGGASPHRKSKKISAGAGDERTGRSSKASARLRSASRGRGSRVEGE